MRSNKFNLKDKVYHITPESPMGIIIDIKYYFRNNTYEYLVAWDYEHSTNCWEEELSYNKSYE